MKYRIIGTLFVLSVLAACYLVTQDGSQSEPQSVQDMQSTTDSNIQPLKIN